MGKVQSSVAWLSRNREVILVWLITAVTWVLGYLAYVRNRGLFFPDSRYYMAMAFWLSGDSQEAARDETASFAGPRGVDMPDTETTFGWGLVQPRVVLPALSAPFMRIFGPYGLAVVPALAAVAFTILLTIFMMKRYGNVAAVATVVLTNASMMLMAFMTGMLTESLSALWSIIALILAWRYARQPGWKLLSLIGLVTVISAFTRQATFILAGAFVLTWLIGALRSRRWNTTWMWPALVVAACSLGAQVLQSIVFPSFSQADQFIRMTGADSLGGAIVEIPRLARHLFVSDVNTFMAEDKPLLFLLFLAIGAMVLFWKHEESHLLFGAMLGVALYNITNGTPTGFRYAVPGLVFYLLPIALMFGATFKTRGSQYELGDKAHEPVAA